ncbi:conserved hypothetical protein [Teredinibacter turnerae T7901]|uniref:Tetratricopeptide repeat domain protein n=2 Tax=Teredinibacter turnerae TaxID=2426 RepID=C5BHV9_TERTT|nr:hypothetical protein [Teredinibacter turnerae]ACR13248.1 conserved hypothetical protein [Teredinibacter turnerae T7901]
MPPVQAQESHITSREDLSYGPVIFDFYQQNYFLGLVEQSVAQTNKNSVALQDSAQVLKGVMQLSYGMPNATEPLFQSLLANTNNRAVANAAWYHLARLYYNKSEIAAAKRALAEVRGELPQEIRLDYLYLSSLLNGAASEDSKALLKQARLADSSPQYGYLLFNMAVTQLRSGANEEGVKALEQLANYTGDNRELQALSDRAKHGLAQLATQTGELVRAWNYLRGVRTTGLYSNRALLSYAWAAIKLKQFASAIPALQLLDQRSIAIAEVQEAKVLLAHLYEQEGSPRKALKSNLLAEKAFKEGIATLREARAIIAKQDVPREFIENLEVIMDETDWYRANASVDYRKLTPFLIDLMASNPFNETLKDLAALYTLEDNLTYWLSQSEQHQLILKNMAGVSDGGELEQILARSRGLNTRLKDQKAEIRLNTLTLSEAATERFQVLLESVERDLTLLDDKIQQVSRIKEPYVRPAEHSALVAVNHQRIESALAQTRELISMLEPVMRKLVNLELAKHEERMNYYWAQSRLAKARLFDSTLLELEHTRSSSSTTE